MSLIPEVKNIFLARNMKLLLLLCFCFEKLKKIQQGTISNVTSVSVLNTELANTDVKILLSIEI